MHKIEFSKDGQLTPESKAVVNEVLDGADFPWILELNERRTAAA